MSKLSSGQRKKLASSSFALPGRRYPIEDASHARNALSRVSQFGTPEEKARVRGAVRRRYPSMGKRKQKAEGFSESLSQRLLRGR